MFFKRELALINWLSRTNESGSPSTECATFREFGGGQIKSAATIGQVTKFGTDTKVVLLREL